MQEINVRRSMLLLKQYEFITSRQQAFEEFAKKPWNLIRGLFKPEWMFRCIDNRQREIISEMNSKMDEAMAKPVIKKVIAHG